MQGRAAFARVLRDMFRKVRDLRFEVGRRVDGGDVWWLEWRFAGRARLIGEIDLEGVSVVTLDEAGRITSHIDHWDGAALFERLPIVGAIMRIVRRAFRA